MIFWVRISFAVFFTKKKEKKLGKLINFPTKIQYLLGKKTG
jgi:hypothetical protein